MIIGMAAARRLMRQHQGIPPRRPRLPLWRLLLGEAGWVLRELVRAPLVVVALLAGGVAAVAVLDAAAPGPVLPWPGRLVVGLLVGLAIARGTWSWVRRRRRRDARGTRRPAPQVAATELVAALVTLVLVGWLAVWLVALLA